MSPQSSPTISSAAQPSRTSPSSSGNALISPAGSPPLILAFLAIGIFSAAMIAVFGWRRVQYPREGGGGLVRDMAAGGERRFGARGGTSGAAATTGGSSSRFGEKPELWDLWTDRNSKVYMVDYGTWDNIMPLAVVPPSRHRCSSSSQSQRTTSTTTRMSSSSAAPLPPPRPVLVYSILGPRALVSRMSAAAAGSIPESVSAPRSRRQRFDDLTPLRLLRRHVRGTEENPTGDRLMGSANRREGSTSEADGGGGADRDGERDEDGDKDGQSQKEIRIAVIIEMPSPLRASSATPKQRHSQRAEEESGPSSSSLVDKAEEVLAVGDGKEGGTLQYCIGVHTCALPVASTGKTSSEQMQSLDDDEK